MKYLKSLSVIMLSLFIVAGCADDDGDDMYDETNGMETEQNMTNAQNAQDGMMGQESIVAIAQDNENLSTLVSALETAGLVGMLNQMSGGPYTVFAPTNEAFENLPEGTLEDLMMQENQQQLTSILQYHVVEGALMASDIQDGQMVSSAEGTQLEFSMDRTGAIMVNGVEIEQTIQASNGVVHVIDEALMPSEM